MWEKTRTNWSTKRALNNCYWYSFRKKKKKRHYRFWSFYCFRLMQGYCVLVCSASWALGRAWKQNLKSSWGSRVSCLLLWTRNFLSNPFSKKTNKRGSWDLLMNYLLRGSGGKPPAGTWTNEKHSIVHLTNKIAGVQGYDNNIPDPHKKISSQLVKGLANHSSRHLKAKKHCFSRWLSLFFKNRWNVEEWH